MSHVKKTKEDKDLNKNVLKYKPVNSIITVISIWLKTGEIINIIQVRSRIRRNDRNLRKPTKKLDEAREENETIIAVKQQSKKIQK